MTLVRLERGVHLQRKERVFLGCEYREQWEEQLHSHRLGCSPHGIQSRYSGRPAVTGVGWEGRPGRRGPVQWLVYVGVPLLLGALVLWEFCWSEFRPVTGVVSSHWRWNQLLCVCWQSWFRFFSLVQFRQVLSFSLVLWVFSARVGWFLPAWLFSPMVFNHDQQQEMAADHELGHSHAAFLSWTPLLRCEWTFSQWWAVTDTDMIFFNYPLLKDWGRCPIPVYLLSVQFPMGTALVYVKEQRLRSW